MLDRILDFLSRGHNLAELSRRLGVPLDELWSVDLAYRKFTVPKRSGKPRTIHAPNSKLKKLQRRILHRLLKKLKVHPQATAFEPGLSFVDNARCHQYQAVVIRFDLVDFFPSISKDNVYRYFRAIGWKRRPARLLAQLTTHEGCLPQGAPTSPKLSNLVNYLFDCKLERIAKAEGAVYTRYADDLTFSFGDDIDVFEFVGRVIGTIRHAGYQPHIKKKLDIRRRNKRQLVTGLVVNESAKLPREKRRWLRAVRHRAKLKSMGGYVGPNPSLTAEQLEGWRSLEKVINAPDGND